MSLKHGILGLLNYGPSTGYDLDKIFKQSLNFFWQAQTSQIYRELSAMESKGWIASEVIIQKDKPNKNLYALTQSGQEELHRWLTSNTIEDDIRVRDPFLVKLFFSGELDTATNIETLKVFKRCCEFAHAKIKETIEQFPTNHQKEHDTNKNSMKNPLYWSFTASFGLYYYAMCIEWAEHTIEQLHQFEP